MSNPNPSPSTRFQKGNPGRPKGVKDKQISRYFLEELYKKVVDGEEEKTQLELLIKQIVKDALSGKDKAREIVLDRAFGKAREIIEAQISAVRIIDSIDDIELLEEGEEEENEQSLIESGGVTSS